ncbi:hypothetical protein PGT21_004358 [Puccinia graminis f. sp. tritici]|uniref:BED-type domain-containing protein n=1 Tax=Puccinia graminis f. sp. tritici TaxID=56615 RepID=A0A5B0MMX8_PUCGR|nr:hypothetical protein PGT21_004358 [Puccinia graminis f. sp. tritici]
MPPNRNSDDLESQGWSKPSKSHGPQWIGFLMSDLLKDQSRKRQAKCTYCKKVLNQAKPTQIFSHITECCVAVSAERKAKYVQEVMKHQISKQLNSSQASDYNDNNDSQIILASIPSSSQSESVQNYFRPISKEKTNHLHELLLKALLSSNIPMTFLKNPYFQEYQAELVCSPYQLPRCAQVMQKILPLAHARNEADLFEKLKDQDHLTLSLDGWTKNSGNSIYALMALKGAKKKYFIDVLDLNSKRHTADNIFLAIIDALDLNSKRHTADNIFLAIIDLNSKRHTADNIFLARSYLLKSA